MSLEQTKNLKVNNMLSTLIYDVKGKTKEGEKSYWDMSDKEIEKLMETERFSLTCAPGGENNRGMEIIGRMPIKGEGFTAKDIEGLGTYFEKLMCGDMKEDGDKVSVFNLNELGLSIVTSIEPRVMISEEYQARVLILRDWAAKTMGAEAWTKEVFKELASRRWDAEYLDPNKYRTEIVDGIEIKVRGKRLNKLARTNLCFVAGREQEPAVYEGKGTIYDLKKLEALNRGVEKLKEQIAMGLIEIGSKTKVEINVVEGNRYYNLKKTGIGFHGDTERVVVICISIGCDNYPMRWQWFKAGMPVGEPIDVILNCGDVYIMSEKAVGAEWKKSSIYTLRHSAGAEKYRSLNKWEKRRPGYEAKLKAKAEKQSIKEAFKKSKASAPKKKKINKKIKGKSKTVDVVVFDEYIKALKQLNWEDNDADFYKWIAVEAGHECTPQHAVFKEFQAIWSGKAKDFATKMNITEWEEKRAFYVNLCAYGSLW